MLAASVHPGIIASGLLPLYARGGAPVGEGAEAVARLCMPQTALTDGAYYDGQIRSSVTGLVGDERAVGRLWKATAKIVGFDRMPTTSAA